MVREMYLQYVETALWSSTDDFGEALDENYSIENVDEQTLATMFLDCLSFYESLPAWVREQVERENDWMHVGRDFWLTRNNHGTGFWQGEWSTDIREFLTSLSHTYGEFYLCVHNRKIYD